MSDEAPKNRTRRLVGEFFLIVAGVTVALGADSLWDYSQDREAERDYLAQIRSDLAENQRRFEDALALEQQQSMAAQAALNAMASGGPIDADSAQAWLVERRGLFYSDPRPVTGTFSALVETGDLRLIREVAKRNAIISYLAQIEADKAEFDRFVEQSLMALRQIREAAASPDYGWSFLGGSAVRALVTKPEDPTVAAQLDHIVTAAEIRRVYLGRMLDATREASAALNP